MATATGSNNYFLDQLVDTTRELAGLVNEQRALYFDVKRARYPNRADRLYWSEDDIFRSFGRQKGRFLSNNANIADLLERASTYQRNLDIDSTPFMNTFGPMLNKFRRMGEDFRVLGAELRQYADDIHDPQHPDHMLLYDDEEEYGDDIQEPWDDIGQYEDLREEQELIDEFMRQGR